MKTKKFALTALFIALSFVGSNLKILGTIAFDSLPAFLGSLVLGPFYGVLIGFVGHFFTAFLSAFPFGIVIHLVIAVGMAITMLGFGFCYKLIKNRLPMPAVYITTGAVGVALNGPFSLALLIPLMGLPAVLGLLLVLTLASAANVIIALVIHKALDKVWSKMV